MRIYIESTIPSYLGARPARNLLQAARPQTTRDWWDLKRHPHALFTSQIVLDEISAGDNEMARQRLAALAGMAVLRVNEAAENLTVQILGAGLLPATADRDAAHIALATYETEILLSWNCRHIANAAIQTRLRQWVEKSGFALPVLCTPDELTGDLYE
jgi:hypothetical protein